jgi:hypothetical protein
MAKTIDQLLGDGGRGLSRESGVDPVKDLFDAAADDLTEIRTQFVALLTQLDTEGGLGGGYVAGFTPAALTLVKG